MVLFPVIQQCYPTPALFLLVVALSSSWSLIHCLQWLYCLSTGVGDNLYSVRPTSFAIIPIHCLGLRQKFSDTPQEKSSPTTGALNRLISWDILFIASDISLAPSMIWPASPSPVYSIIVLNWSPVGGSSVIFNWNSVRCSLFWWVWSVAWSSVAVSDAWADTCLRSVRTRREAGTEGLWKRVMTSRDLCCMLKVISAASQQLLCYKGTYKIEHSVWDQDGSRLRGQQSYLRCRRHAWKSVSSTMG